MTRRDVTVVIPARDRPRLLARAIRSAQRQGATPAAIIVVDDRSDPPLHPAQYGPAPVQTLRLEDGTGAGAARNLGLDAASTSVVAFLDSDDWWSPDYLAQQLAALDHPAAVATYGAVHKVRGDRARAVPSPGPVGEITAAMLAGWSIATTSSLVVDAEAARGVRFDECLTGLQDFDFLLRLSQLGQVGHAPEAFVYFDQHDGLRLTTSPDRRQRGISEVRAKHAAAATQHHREQEFHAFLDREYSRVTAEAQAHDGASVIDHAKRAFALLREGMAETETDRTITFGPRECTKVILGERGLRAARRVLWSSPMTTPIAPGDRPEQDR
jgi:glycosyltransferase involved in cell wall biosynthesis